MSAVKDVIKEEYNRLNSLVKMYDDKILLYPKGSISIKKRSGNSYCYLAYREKQKVRFEYIGKEGSEKAKEYARKIEQRHKYERMRKKSAYNLKEIRKLLRAAK